MTAHRGTAPLPYGRQWIDSDDVAAVTACLTDDYLTQGPRVEEFERRLCTVTGARHAVSVTSGTAALHLAALALGVGPGDVGLTSPITFLASANAIRYAGGDAAFADVDPDDGLLRPDSVEAMAERLALEGRPPKLIIPVDFAGQPADMPRLRQIAGRFGARVLQDSAHSLGATYRRGDAQRPIGCCADADATVLSFHPVKHITTAEGGAVLTNDSEVYDRLLRLRNHGIERRPERLSRQAEGDPMVGSWYHEQVELGFNYRLPDLLCALGISQLRRLDAFVARRRDLAARYDSGLAAHPELASQLTPLAQRPDRASTFHLYVVRVRQRDGETLADVACRRRRLYDFLRDRGILVQVHYIPVPWQPDYAGRALIPSTGLPGAEAYYASCLSLPLFPAMADDDVDRVLEALAAWGAGEGN
ncbi:MAG TPA: UDP-4-amino-4,6-dideoxy-N-acetyl-beta-L-altrosamine transaminase [Thermoanaerobaculia bacterium]|nr:UDP-4-amino-4,6-dideoxy-N-acetyl-beta-L-altrosamine transaminase [Thermoanaerobaculia bacterium]